MGLVTRYFSTTGAGTEDGTSWANRAPLIVAGAWNTIISAFAFTAGADSLECRIGAGTYTCPGLSSGTFTAGTPTRDKCLFFVGADSSGNKLSVPNPGWSSAQPMWDTTNMPLFNFGNNTQNQSHIHFYMMRLEGSNTSGVIGSSGRTTVFTWCEIVGTGTNTGGIVAGGEATNCVIRCTSSNYATVFLPGTNAVCHNVRVEGNSAATGGNRDGFQNSGNGGAFYVNCTSINNPRYGFAHTSGAVVAGIVRMYKCLAYNNGSHGLFTAEDANTSGFQHQIANCVIVNNGGWGVSYAQSPIIFSRNRLRNNTSGNYTTASLEDGINLDNDESAGTDADEFVDHTNGDFRIKNTSSIWGQGYGPMDQPAASSSATVAYFG